MTAKTPTPYDQNWDLDSLLPHPAGAEFTKIIEGYREALHGLAERSDKLPLLGPGSENATAWTAFLRECERLEMQSGDLSSFIGCHAAADAANKLYRQVEATLSALDPWRERISTNLEFALRDAGETDFTKLVDADPFLKSNAFFLEHRRKNARLRLPRGEELLAADLAVDGIHAWGRLYDRLSGELRIKVMEKGEIVEKSPGQIRFDSPERSVRQNNFYAADKAWKSITESCADALNHIAGTRLTMYRRLGLADHLEMPLHKNRMQRATLDTMWSVVTQRKGVLLKYLAAKAKLLGQERLAWYDTQAPLPGADEPGQSAEIPYDAGAELVVRTFSGFSKDFGEFARMALTQGWVEADRAVGVRLSDGTEQRADIIVSNANGHATIFDMLGGRYTSAAIRACYAAPEDRIEMGIHVSLGMARDLSAEPHAIVLPLAAPVTIAGKARHRLYVEPFAFDPSLAPAHKSALKVVMAASYAYWEELQRTPERYHKEKQRVAEVVIGLLEARFPGLRQQIEVVDVATPMTTLRFTGNGHGFRSPVTAMARALFTGRRLSQTLPGLGNFYMVGQWAGVAGVPLVAAMGRDVVRGICHRDRRAFTAQHGVHR
jgi:hypothetical protein